MPGPGRVRAAFLGCAGAARGSGYAGGGVGGTWPRCVRSTRVLTSELEFELPRERIATRPVEPRDAARLLVVSRSDRGRLEHRRVRDLPALLDADDTLVFNTTRVLPARLLGVNLDTGGRVAGLYLRDGEAGSGLVWEVLLKARRFRSGRRIGLEGADGRPSGVVLTLLERTGDEAGAWRVLVSGADGRSTGQILAGVGRTPLPPYILSARKERSEPVEDAEDRAAYQTVYAEASGSVAAPTAGLHFTPRLLDELGRRGVGRADVTLHVGSGTFKPVECERVEDHPMHAEWCSLAGSEASILGAPGRVVAVGTTSARTIESYAGLAARGLGLPEWLETDLLITPGYSWRRVDGLLTNFHLPHSTLLAMVAAFLEDGRGDGMARLKRVYAEAIGAGYRFFSYGDAMLLLA